MTCQKERQRRLIPSQLSDEQSTLRSGIGDQRILRSSGIPERCVKSWPIPVTNASLYAMQSKLGHVFALLCSPGLPTSAPSLQNNPSETISIDLSLSAELTAL